MNNSEDLRGAEASVKNTLFLNREAVVKIRLPKTYRHPELDKHIRTSRMKTEARMIADAREIGVRTPVIYDIDLAECSITMEKVEGDSVKNILDKSPELAHDICAKIGHALAIMHNGKMCHGDLTTSNMILTGDGEICFIDMSMGKTSAEIEDMGVDIRLMERAFDSAHPDLKDACKDIILAYSETANDFNAVIRKVEEIKSRGRYT